MRTYEVTLARDPNTHAGFTGRRHTVTARTAREAKMKLIAEAGWRHCFWTIWNTKVRWLQ